MQFWWIFACTCRSVSPQWTIHKWRLRSQSWKLGVVEEVGWYFSFKCGQGGRWSKITRFADVIYSLSHRTPHKYLCHVWSVRNPIPILCGSQVLKLALWAYTKYTCHPWFTLGDMKLWGGAGVILSLFQVKNISYLAKHVICKMGMTAKCESHSTFFHEIFYQVVKRAICKPGAWVTEHCDATLKAFGELIFWTQLRETSSSHI